jgi:hypothetical protein
MFVLRTKNADQSALNLSATSQIAARRQIVASPFVRPAGFTSKSAVAIELFLKTGTMLPRI